MLLHEEAVHSHYFKFISLVLKLVVSLIKFMVRFVLEMYISRCRELRYACLTWPNDISTDLCVSVTPSFNELITVIVDSVSQFVMRLWWKYKWKFGIIKLQFGSFWELDPSAHTKLFNEFPEFIENYTWISHFKIYIALVSDHDFHYLQIANYS